MMERGWRTIVIQSPSRLTIKEGQMSVYDLVSDAEHLIPVEEIRRLMVTTSGGIISFNLLQRLLAYNVSVIFCDHKHVPCGEMTPYGQHEESAGRIMDQSAWSQEWKDIVWSTIVRQKINNQISALETCGIDVPTVLMEYACDVEPGDPTNREAMAAKVYFHALFGMNFGRHGRDMRNASLNYGYAIICSAAARTVSMHGYHMAMGVHHHSRGNRLNLACDIMEPFRPFVDTEVFRLGKRYLDNATKAELIRSMQRPCLVNRRRMSVDDGIEFYGQSILRALSDESEALPEVRFE